MILVATLHQNEIFTIKAAILFPFKQTDSLFQTDIQKCIQHTECTVYVNILNRGECLTRLIIEHDNIDTVQTDKTRLYEAEYNSSSKFNPFRFIVIFIKFGKLTKMTRPRSSNNKQKELLDSSTNRSINSTKMLIINQILDKFDNFKKVDSTFLVLLDIKNGYTHTHT